MYLRSSQISKTFQEPPSDIRLKAQALLQQAQPARPSRKTSAAQPPIAPPTANEPSTDDVHITPLPGETLATFYARTKAHWAQKALQQGMASSDNREKQSGKQLRRDGFALAEERWEEYKPVLKEVERILEESGASGDAEGGTVLGGSGKVGGLGGGVGFDSRNRR